MDADAESELEWGRRDRLLANLARMVESRRVTETEAERLRTAAEPTAFNKAVRGIRIRHAGLELGAAVVNGSLTRAEADGFLDRLRRGEHGHFLRAHVRTLRPGGASPRPGPRSQRHEDASK